MTDYKVLKKAESVLQDADTKADDEHGSQATHWDLVVALDKQGMLKNGR